MNLFLTLTLTLTCPWSVFSGVWGGVKVVDWATKDEWVSHVY